MKLTAADYFERARTHFNEGDSKGALADINKAIQLAPRKAISYNARGDIKRFCGDVKGALADINKAIRLDPHMADAYFSRGEIKRSGGDANGAITDFTKVIKLDPKFALAYVSRGNARRNLNDLNRAIVDFNKAIKLEPKNALGYIGRGMARSQKGIDGSINDFNKAIKLDPKSSEAYFGRGWARTDTKKAISDFTSAIKLNPRHGMAYMLRGEAYRDNCETDKAIADFTKAIKIGVPNWAHAYGNRGSERLKKGDFNRALADFDKAIELEPKLAVAYLGRGTANLQKGNTEQAIGDLNLAVKLDVSLKSIAHPLLERCIDSKRDSAFHRWAKNYRASARLDGYRSTMKTLYLENDRATLRRARRSIRENIELVAVAMSFAQLDNKAADFAPVIAKQTHDAEASLCRYIVFFFDYSGNTRWLVVDELREIDLADLVPAGQLTVPPVVEIRIRHPGKKPFSQGEHARIEKAVEYDLRFDFDESELSIEFTRNPFGLQVLLQVHD